LSSPSPQSPARFTIKLDGSIASVAKYGIIQFLRRSKSIRILIAVVTVGLFGFAIVIFLNLTSIRSSRALPLAFVCIYLLWLVTVSGSDFEFRFPTQDAAKQREEAEIQFKDSNDPYDVLALDFKRLNEYYVINQAQARNSFRWAVFAMLFGFATIITGVWLFYIRRDTPDTFMASLSTASGLVVNVVSGLFLYLHHETQKRSLHYYQQLSQIQKIALAIRLAESHADATAKARNRVIEQLLTANGVHDNAAEQLLRT
jgi:TRADD-N domain-containing protein